MIFLDNASTTIVDKDCQEICNKYYFEEFYNPSAMYHSSIVVKNSINDARKTILKALHANDGDIIFTASGSEANNLALLGTKKQKGSKIIISASEHPAIYNTALELKQRGYEIVEAEVDLVGRVKIDEFAKIMDKDVSMVSIMYVNNETGCINDIKKLCEIAKSINPNVIFHTDAIQATAKIDINIRNLGIDLLSMSGHKFHSPKGIGALYVTRNINLRPIIFGGGQENGIRSATENVAGIMCMAHQLDKLSRKIESNYNQVKSLKNSLVQNLDKNNYFVVSDDDCSPYILCVAMKFVRGEVMLHSLEKYGIMIGTGSACSSQKSSKRIPRLFQLLPEYEKGIIRVSFDDKTTKEDIEYFIKQLNLEYSLLVKYMRG
ncbi:MAG: cysteine desulfurase family protein [Clostridia bacterium]